ncbi:MAG TPA: ATP-binding protein [Clostridia bacterium]|nr:ATP-binding protein [Clostridia bacterium]
MFNKLKLRLTLGNLAVVILIFIIVFTGVYITMYRSITSQTVQLINLLTYSIVSGENTPNPSLLGLFGNHDFFIVEKSASGNIFITPPMPELTGEYIKELADKAMTSKERSRQLVLNFTDIRGKSPADVSINVRIKAGTIQSSTGNLFSTRLITTTDGNISIIFVNIDYENSLLRSLGINLVIVAMIGLGLVFAGSYFMAGRAIKPINAAWEKQKSFVADASHELRTPLSVMQTNLELVMENKEETVESQSKWLENIYVENKHMTRLVSNLLLLARVDSGQKLLEMKNFPLSMSVEEAATPFVPVAEEKGIKIDLSINPDVNFYGDESKIRQLVVILLDNAVKYTSSGGRISLELKSNKDSIEILVSDTGEGIGKEDLDRIFERFYRIDKARSSETDGIGLGLSIASWIVKEHHGIITVDSTLGKGTTFKIVFPKNTK